MITVKASQKLFTYAEVTSLGGICAEHLENLVKRHRSGFIGRAMEAQDNQTDQWFFGPSDSMFIALCTLKSRAHFKGCRLGTGSSAVYLVTRP
jgi:hypothetical protein